MKFREMSAQVKFLYTMTLGILSCALALSIALPLSKMPKRIQPVALQSVPEPHQASGALEFIQERAQIRAKEREELQAIIDDKDQDAQLRAEAGQRMMQLLAWTEQETTIEGVMRIRGYRDPVVTVHLDSANVLFRGAQVSREQSAQLLDLVSRETGLSGGNRKIIPIS